MREKYWLLPLSVTETKKQYMYGLHLVGGENYDPVEEFPPEQMKKLSALMDADLGRFDEFMRIVDEEFIKNKKKSAGYAKNN